MWEVRDGAVDDAARAPIELEKPRLAALRGGFLRDEFRRKIEIELADVHVRECTPEAQCTRWSGGNALVLRRSSARIVQSA